MTKSPTSAFDAFRLARDKAMATNAPSFTYKNNKYVKTKWANGLVAYKKKSRKSRRKSR